MSETIEEVLGEQAYRATSMNIREEILKRIFDPKIRNPLRLSEEEFSQGCTCDEIHVGDGFVELNEQRLRPGEAISIGLELIRAGYDSIAARIVEDGRFTRGASQP